MSKKLFSSAKNKIMNTTQIDLNEKSNSERKQVEEYLDNLDYRKRINQHQKMYPCGCGSTCLH